MAYFNQLQGYMSNLKEGQAHMDDMKNEAINKKTAGIEDKFNAISQQAEGWGGAITQSGIVWKHGRKVMERLGKKGQGDSTGSSTTTEPATTTPANEVGANDLQGLGNQADHIASSVEGDARTAVGNIADAIRQQLGVVPAAGDTNVLDAGRMVVRAANNKAPTQTGQGVNQGDDPLLGGLRGDSTIARATGGGGARATQTNPTQPSQAPRSNGDGRGGGAEPNESSLGDNVGSELGDSAGSIGSRVASGIRRVAGAVGADEGAVMGAVNTTLDSIPIIGELVGIGTLVGGLIHGLHKKGEDAREAGAQTAGGSGSAAGGIAASKVFTGNTLSSGGGGYIA
jgi:hypothetical protein